MNDPSCIFCKIIQKEIPTDFIYEDESTVAFLDIKPNNPGHTLVVPKVHYKNIFDIDENALRELSLGIKKIASAVKKGVLADGINIIMNNDSAAGQLVFHAHIHIIPRFLNDGYRPWPGKEYKEGEASIVAKKIKANL
ncbi:MAG: HIT family protein [Patescibacteria group bacterium]